MSACVNVYVIGVKSDAFATLPARDFDIEVTEINHGWV